MNLGEQNRILEYGASPESAAEAFAWIVDQGSAFGCFVDGAFTTPGMGFDSHNPANNEILAKLTQAGAPEVEAAIRAARQAQPKWERRGGAARARCLELLARLLDKHAKLFAVLEVLDTGKTMREVSDVDLPAVLRCFRYHAGLAEIMADIAPGRVARGICGQVIHWNAPLLSLARKVAPALAAGNTVVLKPDQRTSLSALLFADICRQAGLPRGVFNLVTGDDSVGEMLAAHPEIDMVFFAGPVEVGRGIRRATAGQGKALSLDSGGKWSGIICDDADLDSAVEDIADAIWRTRGHVGHAGARLFVQEGIADRSHDKLKARMERLRMGNPLDACTDIGAMINTAERDRVARMVETSENGARFCPELPLPAEGSFYPPTLITGLYPADRLMHEELVGPVLVSTTFRTSAEAVALANNTCRGHAASVWSENVNLALGMVPKLIAGVVWVNGANMSDAAVPSGGVGAGNLGQQGGPEGLRDVTKPTGKAKVLRKMDAFKGDDLSGGTSPAPTLYIGGKKVRLASDQSRNVYARGGRLLGQMGMADRKDIDKAVTAARSAAAWSCMPGPARAQFLCVMAEGLQACAAEFASRLNAMTGARSGRREVDAAIGRLQTCAAWADKYDGAVHGVPLRGMVMSLRESLGVIAALCADEAPLLGLVSVLGAALAMGNRAVLVPSEPFSLIAVDFMQVLDAADLPAGVVNILTGEHADLASPLAQHSEIEAVWSFSSTDLSARIERDSALSLKRTWVNNARARDWYQADTVIFLEQACAIKALWIPCGE